MYPYFSISVKNVCFKVLIQNKKKIITSRMLKIFKEYWFQNKVYDMSRGSGCKILKYFLMESFSFKLKNAIGFIKLSIWLQKCLFLKHL